MFDCDKIEHNYLYHYTLDKKSNFLSNGSNRRLTFENIDSSGKLQSNDNKSNIISTESNINMFNNIPKYNRFIRKKQFKKY
jgi:hypothetical protein